MNYCENFCPDVVNIVNLVTLNSPTHSSLEVTNYNNNVSDKEEVNLNDFVSDKLSNAASLESNRYKANFVSPNAINLSKLNLTKDEISLLSKVIQFVPTPKHFNNALLREELKYFGRKLRLKWFFHNDERQANINLFEQKSKFNPRKNYYSYSYNRFYCYYYNRYHYYDYHYYYYYYYFLLFIYLFIILVIIIIIIFTVESIKWTPLVQKSCPLYRDFF